MFLKVHIKQFERGLLFRRGDFIRPLGPGTYRIPIWRIGRDHIQVVDTLKTKFEHPLLEQLAVVDNSDTQRALVWRDGRVFAIVGPGRHAFWTTPAAVAVEQYDV